MTTGSDVRPTSEVAAVQVAQLLAAEKGAVLARLPATVVRVHGADAAPFLHGQLANDVTGLKPGGVNQGLSLTHKGHAVAESSVLRRAAGDLLLVVDDQAGAWVVDSLESHIIVDQVTLDAPEASALLTLQGAGAAASLQALHGALPAQGEFVEFEVGGSPVLAYERRRSGWQGFDLVVPDGAAAALVSALVGAGAQEVDAAVVAALRVRALVATAAGEAGEGVLPQEAGLAGSLSYRKGCYLGQEIMARIEARGNLRRSLVHLELAGPAPSGQPITAGDRTVGRLGSVVGLMGPDGAITYEALAVLRNDLPEDASLAIGGVAVCRVLNRA